MNKNQLKTTSELLNQMNKRVSSLSPIIDHSDSREYQSINNLQSMVTGKDIFCVMECLIFFSDVLEHTNNEEKHF